MRSIHRTFAMFAVSAGIVGGAIVASATSNYSYKGNEYPVIENGVSPNGELSVASHGEGELGYDNFQLYLMSARTGKRIGPLEEVRTILDTAPDAFRAQWSADSKELAITYRTDRHETNTVRYRIEGRRAIPIDVGSER